MTASHDPYSCYDRFPQGACPAGSVVWLRVVSSQPLSAVFVRLWRGGGEERLPMRAAGGNAYEANVPIGNDTGLVWYYFILKTEENACRDGRRRQADRYSVIYGFFTIR